MSRTLISQKKLILTYMMDFAYLFYRGGGGVGGEQKLKALRSNSGIWFPTDIKRVIG